MCVCVCVCVCVPEQLLSGVVHLEQPVQRNEEIRACPDTGAWPLEVGPEMARHPVSADFRSGLK